MFGKLNQETVELTCAEKRFFRDNDLFCTLDSGAINHNQLLKGVAGGFCQVAARVSDQKVLPEGFYRLSDSHYVEILFDIGCYCLVPTVGQGYGFPLVSGKTESTAILAWEGLAYRVEVNKNVDVLELSKRYPGWPIYRVCPTTDKGLKFVDGGFQGYPLDMASRRFLSCQYLTRITSATSEYQKKSLELEYQRKVSNLASNVQTCFRNTRLSPMVERFPW